MALPGFTGSFSLSDKHIYHSAYHIAAPDDRIYPQPRVLLGQCLAKCNRDYNTLISLCDRNFHWDFENAKCLQRVYDRYVACYDACYARAGM